MRREAAASNGVRALAQLSAAAISIIDAAPEELLVLHVEDVQAGYDFNMGAGARFTRTALSVKMFKVRWACTVCR